MVVFELGRLASLLEPGKLLLFGHQRLFPLQPLGVIDRNVKIQTLAGPLPKTFGPRGGSGDIGHESDGRVMLHVDDSIGYIDFNPVG